MYPIHDDLKDFIESDVATLIGSAESPERPHIAWGWAPRVKDEGVIEVFLDAERADRTIANLRANPRIALTMAQPITYRSVQLKGDFLDVSPPSEEDEVYVQRRREGFVSACVLVGDPPEAIRNLWLDDVVGITFSVDRAFDQTPGPNAGKPL
jgi:hypothetical protein